MPKVYAPQIPSRLDHGSKMWIPSIDITPASKFGEVITMLPPGAERAGPAQCEAAIRERLRDFTEDDYLIAIGSPALMVAAGIEAFRKIGRRPKMLVWDRNARDYIPVE